MPAGCNRTFDFGIISVLPTCQLDILTKGCSWHHGSLAWKNNSFLYDLVVLQEVMFYEKTHLINCKLNSEIKSWRAMIFKMKKKFSKSFRHTHYIGSKYMLDIQIFKKKNTHFLQNIALVLVSVNAR